MSETARRCLKITECIVRHAAVDSLTSERHRIAHGLREQIRGWRSELMKHLN